MPIQATTTLPDVPQPALDNGIEDEVTASYSDISNYGSYRGQIRETEQSSWDSSAVGFDEVVVDQTNSSITFGGLEDGEAYEVRIRSETEHVTGAWTSPVAITTTFPTPTDVSAAADSATQVTVSWTDQADNEDGFEILRTRSFADGTRTRSLATLGANTESYTDTTAQPSADYEYTVRAFTEDAEAVGSDTATTPSVAKQTPTDSAGWTVEVERADGTTRRPSILDDPSIRPTLNGRPEVEVAVRPDDSWLSTEWEDSAMRVWRDGQRIPIDTLAQVSPEPDRTVLVGRGGDELQQRVQQDFDDVTAETAIESILDEVSYDSTVDPAPTADNELLTTLDSTEELGSAAQSLSGPRAVDNGQARPKQSAVIVPPGDISSGKLVTDTRWNWTASEALELDVAALESTGVSIDLPYALDASDWGLYYRIADNYEGFIEVRVDGALLGADSAFNPDETDKSVEWQSALNPGTSITDDKIPVSGTVDITFTAASDTGGNDIGPAGEAFIDSVVLFDKREQDPSNFSNTLRSDIALLDGPPALFTPTDFDFDAVPIRRATGGRVEAPVSSTANGQAVAVSPDGETFVTATNATSVEDDFASSTGQFVARTTLGGIDGDGGSNVEDTVTRYRTQPQTLDSLTIKYDSIDSPGVSETVDATVVDALSKYADRANLIWELQYDDGFEVVVTRPGQRSSAADPDLVDWRVDKDIEAEATKAVVHGQSKQIEEEQFVADLNDVQLDNDDILKGSTRVYDSTTEYGRGPDADYVINETLGTIQMPDLDSNLVEGNTYNIDYEAEVVGDFTGDRHADVRQPEIVDIPQIISQPQADQAALYIVDQSQGPVVSAQATLSRQDIGYRLTESLDLSALPDVGDLRVRSIAESPREVVLELGLGQSVGDVVNDIRSSLSDTARQT
ncbi:fibronectin type III domain-containing protein [Haloarcula sebkhae]|uniref:Uncharacterized protein n=2 Tax=Haloarcula sebkhae TaxID=932660 RepID=A0ACC6VIH9_9EURY|nr:fibronectin type III domain-containing protein [Haloarcula sebkhae]GGK74467.1 hypothetical protein GCM10009067_28330 [Haloarcula sebkhae]